MKLRENGEWFFLLKGKIKPRLLWKLSLWSTSDIFLKAFIDIKKKIVSEFSLWEDFLGENSKPPTNKDLAFVTVLFSLLRWHLLVRHVACAQRRKTNLHGSHDLEIWGKKTNKYRSGGNFSHRKTNSWWPVKSWLDKSNITGKIKRFPLTRSKVISTYSQSCS